MELDFNFKYNKKLLHDKLNQLKKTTDQPKSIKVVNQNYENKSEQFTQEYKNSNFIQYAHLYYIRLYEIKNTMHKIAESKWSKVKICKNILDVKGNVKLF